jgi:VWFA-related protein
MKRLCVVLIGCFLASGQAPPTPTESAQRETVVFTVTSTLVQIDAVVTDSKGRHVTDLTAADFEVLEDGKPQKLTHFAYVQTSPAARPPGPATTPLSRLALWLPPSPELRPEDVRRTIVLMVDDLGLSFESMAFVRRSLRKFVEKQMQPGDLVAVCRTGAGSGALQKFTADKRILLSIIDGLRWNPNGRFGIGVWEPLGKYGDTQPQLVGGGDPRSREVSYDTARRNAIVTVGTLGAISHVVGALRELPGRKSIVVFSDGLRLFQPADGPRIHTGPDPTELGMETNVEVIDALRKLIDRANRAGTVIYTMQASGLDTLQLGAQDNVRLRGLSPSAVQSTLAGLTGVGGGRDLLFHIGQQGLAFLAYQTGGLAYENGNDLNWGLDRVLEDQQGYYLLGYKPSESTFEARHGARGFHGITVKVKRAGLHVRSRSGFFGETDEESRPKYATPLDQMRASMLSPFHSSSLRLRLTALYSEAGRHGPVVRNLLHIDARDLTFVTAADGSSQTQVEMLAVAVGTGDRTLATVARSYTFHVAAGLLEQARKEGALYTLDVPVRQAGAYQIRVAVRDAWSANVGSASQFIDIPDVKKKRLSLTSVVLQDGERSPATPGFLTLTPARRQFRRGGRLEYACMVEAGRKKGTVPDLAAQIRIVRDGREVYSAPAKLADLKGGGRTVYGLLKLADAIPPGEYYMQVVATDRASKNTGAEQWTDFQVLPEGLAATPPAVR